MSFFLKSKREPYAEILQYTNRLCGAFFAMAEAIQFKSCIIVLNIWVWGFFKIKSNGCQHDLNSCSHSLIIMS